MTNRNAPFFRNLILLCAGVTLIPSMAMARSANDMADMPIGRWINPRGSVVVETGSCGNDLCGKVSWASAEAKQDASAAGINPLIGIELLQDYSRAQNGIWHGRVYVPDMRRTFQSTISVQDPKDLRISGCLLGGLVCKSQIWHRL
jgi:uncharacterized protein (DUF2147 family)